MQTNIKMIWFWFRTRTGQWALGVLPLCRVLLLTLLSGRGSPRTATPAALPRLPAGLVQGQKLGPVQDIVPLSGPAPGLAAGHGSLQAVEL